MGVSTLDRHLITFHLRMSSLLVRMVFPSCQNGSEGHLGTRRLQVHLKLIKVHVENQYRARAKRKN